MPTAPICQHTNKMRPHTKSYRWSAPAPTGIQKLFQDIWDEKRDTQVKTFMRYENKMCCLNFAATLKRAADDYMLLSAQGKAPEIVTVMGSYKVTDADNKKANKYTDNFMLRLGVDDTDYITKYLDERNIAVLQHGRYTTGCLEFEDGSLGVISPTTGFMANKSINDLHSIETFYAHLKITTPEKFAEWKKHRCD